MKQTSLSRIVGLLFIALAMVGCTEEISSLFTGDDEIKAGDPVMFTTYMPGTAVTRTNQSDFIARMETFKPVAADYEFNIQMYEQGIDEPLGSAKYKPLTTIGENETVIYHSDEPLTGSGSPLYWPGNAKKYAFMASAGTSDLEIDQTTETKLLKQDLLWGYSFEPLWNTEGDAPVDDENALNYRTAKEWYAANKQTMGVQSSNEAYKMIPLYLKHQRSLITIKLKAGEGVSRDALKTLENIETIIYNYYGSTIQEIQPFAANTTINYVASDPGGVASNVPTSEFTAVVEPHNYLEGATSDVIAEIRLSGQRFTFYASSDDQFSSYENNAATDHATAVTHMQGYNLTPGKHLTITATLGRGSRKIVITSYIEDWTETVTTSIVDDYGQAGDPIQINTRKELYEFLSNEKKNKAGNVAIIVPNQLNLEQSEGVALEWTPMPLNCTLNMAGAVFRTNHQVFSTIGPSGNLVNGTISVGDAFVASAVAATNLGTIERVTVLPKDVNGNNSTGKATQGGLVITNSGTITECTSELPVVGNATTGTAYVGGIAASSVYSADNGNIMPVIDGCSVNARVDGGTGNRGGGIVGEAVGRVTNNTFTYGITISQDATHFKNIIQTKADTEHDLRAYSNGWPTNATNTDVSSNNTNRTVSSDQYDAVIDSQLELARLLSSTYNLTDKTYRLSNDFSVTKSGANGWNYGGKQQVFNSSGTGNVFFKLDGNNKTITTDAMLFSSIQNEISDLTIRLSADMIATEPKAKIDNVEQNYPSGESVMAPLAYALYGPNAKISNIQVKGGNYRIQAATVGGIVVWACGGATIEDCQCKANLQVWVKSMNGEAKIYSGGIVACAAKATITRCVFHNTDGTLFRNLAGTEDHTGTTENPLTFDGSVTDPETTPTNGIYYGGILGGTAPTPTVFFTTTETPSVLITDCTSWFNGGDNEQTLKGAIVGNAEYPDGNSNDMHNGIADGCQGNWWSSSSKGVGTVPSGKTVEQLIGKRNAVEPTQDANY